MIKLNDLLYKFNRWSTNYSDSNYVTFFYLIRCHFSLSILFYIFLLNHQLMCKKNRKFPLEKDVISENYKSNRNRYDDCHTDSIQA